LLPSAVVALVALVVPVVASGHLSSPGPLAMAAPPAHAHPLFVPCHLAAAGQSANWKTELLENMEKCKCQWVNGLSG